jgi:hypothetical protein
MDGVRVGLASVRIVDCSVGREVRETGGSMPLLKADGVKAPELGAGPVFDGDNDLARSTQVSHDSRKMRRQCYQLV